MVPNNAISVVLSSPRNVGDAALYRPALPRQRSTGRPLAHNPPLQIDQPLPHAQERTQSRAGRNSRQISGVGDGGHVVNQKGGVAGGATDRHTMALDDDFQQAAKDAGDKLPSSLPNEDKLVLYGLYKQATVGDNQSSRPGMFDPKGRAKWDAWEAQKGKEQDVAKQEYIMKVQQLKEAHGVS